MIRPIILLAAALLALAAPSVFAQLPKPLSNPADTAESQLLAAASDESKRGTWLFYSEAYLDSDRQRAVYSGSIFGSLQDLQVKGCDIKANILLVDLFSGSAGKKRFHEEQDAYAWTVSFHLTSAIATSLSLRQARPAQLASSTHASCASNTTCSFTWLRIASPAGDIRQISTINGIPRSDGFVDHFMIPISSEDSGLSLIAQFRAVAASRCL